MIMIHIYLDGFHAFLLFLFSPLAISAVSFKKNDTPILVATIAFWPGEPQPKQAMLWYRYDMIQTRYFTIYHDVIWFDLIQYNIQ